VASWVHKGDNFQRDPVMRIEEKISDDCFSILIFSCVCVYNSDTGFVAIVKFCRVMLNCVH